MHLTCLKTVSAAFVGVSVGTVYSFKAPVGCTKILYLALLHSLQKKNTKTAVQGYVITDKNIIECEYGQYFIDKYGRVFEYDEYYDFAYEIRGTAYTINGYPAVFDENNAVEMCVM